jgi:hypothetical protein
MSGTAFAQTAPNVSKAMDELRSNLQAVRSDVLAKNITLTAGCGTPSVRIWRCAAHRRGRCRSWPATRI